MAEYRYYLIPDAMTRAFPEQFGKQTPTEFFDNIADLEKRYHQLREMPYNNERTWNERTRFPYARLVVGIDRQNPDGAVAIIQVRNGVNYLCDDYRGPYADRSDAQIPQMAKKLVEVIGVDRVRPHTYTQRDGYTWVQVEKDMHITEWLYAHELCSSLQFTRFLNRDGRELFQVRDGQRVIETNADGTKRLRAVKNIDVTHAYVVSAETFSWIDYQIYKCLWQWATRRHRHKGRKWIAKKYWHYIGTRQWTFAAELKGDSTKAPYLALEYATNTNILRFKKIVAEANPFDERWNGYYEERDGEKMLNSTKGREKLLKLWRNQKHLCPVCNEPITSETSFKVHKIFENGTYRKSMMVHPLCHNKLHNSAVCSCESGFREEALRMSYMKQHFREPHFFIESAEGNDYFRVTPKVYDNLMGKPKKKPSREQGER